MDVKNGESEWSSCPRNKPSRMTAPTMQPVQWCDVKSLTLHPRCHLENHPDREMFLDINSPPYQGATEACKRCVGPR